MQLNCLKAVAVNKYQTFDQFKSIIETSVDESFKSQKYTDYFKKIGDRIESKKANIKIAFVKQFCFCRGEFIQEVCAFSKKYPSNYDIHILMSNKISISDKEKYEALVNNLIKYDLNPRVIKKAVDKIIELGIIIDVDQNIMKHNLQKLNRKYSQKLITDKTNYEAIVASIRTALETF